MGNTTTNSNQEIKHNKLILPKPIQDSKKIKKRINSSPISFMGAITPPQIATNVQPTAINTQTFTVQNLSQPSLELLNSSLDFDIGIFGDMNSTNQVNDPELEKLYNECSTNSGIPANVISSCINHHLNTFLNNPSNFFTNCL